MSSRAMRYLSVCSGIEAATVAWKPLGWEAAAFAEIEKFPSAVLAHHYPDVPNLGDMAAIKGEDYRGLIDVLVGGTPCQAFSIAGLRAGLDDPRGQLTLAYFRLAGRMRPRWLVWENVPGVLSDDEGRTFGTFLGALVELGYGFAWRVLDAQYFGVPQRRRRVFLVGYLGDWRPPFAVLFERHSLSGDTPPGRGQREDVAGAAESRFGRNGGAANGDLNGGRVIHCSSVSPAMSSGAPFSGTGNSRVECDALVTQALTCRLGSGGPDDNKAQGGFYVPVTAKTLLSDGQRIDPSRETFVAPPLTHKPYADNASRESGLVFAIQERACSENIHAGPQGKGYQADVAYTIEARNKVQAVASTLRGEGYDASEDGTGNANLVVASLAIRGRDGGGSIEMSGDLATALRSSQGGGDKPCVMERSAVRRLTPTECERLQGFPDGYTAITYRGKPAADGPRYKALGNSMCVDVMRWIGGRISLVEDILAGEG